MATMFATMLTTLGAPAAGAAATAGTAAAGAAATSGILSGISTAITVVGGLTSIIGGAQESRALESQAEDEELKASQETIQGKQDVLASLQALNSDMAKIAVAGFASGIGSEGSTQAAQDEAGKIADANISMSRENAKFRSAGRRQQAGQLRQEGRAAVGKGVFGAIKGGLSLWEKRLKRG